MTADLPDFSIIFYRFSLLLFSIFSLFYFFINIFLSSNFCISLLALGDGLSNLSLHFLQFFFKSLCVSCVILRINKNNSKSKLCVCSPAAKSRLPVATHCSSISPHLDPNNNYCLTARPTLIACLLNNSIVKWRSADRFVTPPRSQ